MTSLSSSIATSDLFWEAAGNGCFLTQNSKEDIEMTVRFPVYFEVVGYQELKLPDDINPSDEHSVLEFISDHWDDVPLPPMDEVEYCP